MTPQRPNIVLILSDEQHTETVGCYGGLPARTPAADRLAAEGMRFDSAFCCSAICSPSRAALFTGQLPHRFGDVANDLTIAHGTANLAGLLRRAGYRLGFSGKWHVDHATVPTMHGFEGQDFPGYGFPAWMFTRPIDPAEMRRKPNAYYEYLMECGFEVPTLTDAQPVFEKERPLVIHGRQSGPVEASIPYFVGEQGVRLAESLCRRREMDGQPFFLSVNFWGPHNPCYIPEPYFSMFDPRSIPEPPSSRDKYENKPRVHALMSHYWGMNGAPWSFWQEHLARYLGYGALIDDQVARVRQALEAAGQMENTLFVFATDHGDMIGRHQIMDKGPTMYDDTYRVPMIVRGPGVRRGTCNEFVYLHDLFPTILEAAGAQAAACDAQSLMPLLGGMEGNASQGSPAWASREEVFGEFDRQIYHYPQRMVRTRRHKLVYNAADICELYDLERDPHEMNNRIDDPDYAAVKRDLRDRLLTHLKATGDRQAFTLDAVGWAM